MTVASGTGKNLSAIKQALLHIRVLKGALARASDKRPEPIAIIGMGCRFPGSVHTPEDYWRLLVEGRDAVTEVPADRWDVDSYYDPDPTAPGKMYTRHGAFLGRIDLFDPMFFGIAPREAEFVDPQQRLLLEVAWEALERAGRSADALRGSRTGVFIGSIANEYTTRVASAGSSTAINAYLGTGAAGSFLAGRVSYQFGFRGPSLTVDTACSSSLVAIHLACQSLRAKECDLALAGGVNLLLTPETSVLICTLRALSPTGRCKTFDASADGYVRAEGCGVIVLCRLFDAQRLGDQILAIIRGTGVNHGGAGAGLTVPNVDAQCDVIRRALSDGQVDPATVSYVEAHGTGTALGDPIELRALCAALDLFGREPDLAPLLVGSVKTNIGHSEGAAGVAGLIKVVLALQQGIIPGHLHLATLNPHIADEGLPVQTPSTAVTWPHPTSSARVATSLQGNANGAGEPRSTRTPAARVAGVSSFGMSGTNAHMIIEEAPPRLGQAEQMHPAQPQWHLLCFSARNEPALRELSGRYGTWLADHPTVDFADVCYTAAVGRSHFEHRVALVGQTAESVQNSLKVAAAGDWSPLEAGTAGEYRKVAFLFTGQGSQYVGMGHALYQTEPVFRDTINQCAHYLGSQSGATLLEVLYPNDGVSSPIHATRWTQPALFAVEYALAQLWESWGIHPDVVLGHSLGEYVAACVAGVFGWEDALHLVAERGRLMQSLPAGGAMAAVFTDAERVATFVARDPQRLAIAALNGPANVVISGEQSVLESVLGELRAGGIGYKQLAVSHAFHSPLLEPALDAFEEFASTIRYQRAQRTLICNLTGLAFGEDRVFDASYWRRHARRPVEFARSIQTLSELGCNVLLEVGPQPVLLGMASACWPETQDLPVMVGSLRIGQPDAAALCHALARLYTAGVTPDFEAVHRPWLRQKVTLPTYPFQRTRFWAEVTRPSSPIASVEQASPAGDQVLVGPVGPREPRNEPLTGSESAVELLWDGNTNGRDTVSRFLAKHVQRILRLPHLPGCHISLFDLGMDSLTATELCSVVNTALRPEPPWTTTTIRDHRSIGEMADYLESQLPDGPGPSRSVARSDSAQDGDCLTWIRRSQDGGLRLFFLPDFTGGQLGFCTLTAALRPEFSCAVLHPPVQSLGGQLLWSREWVQHYAQSVLKEQPQGPYLLVGYSLGGLLGLELARFLIGQCCGPVAVALLDSRPRGSPHEQSLIHDIPALSDIVKLPAANFLDLIGFLDRIEQAKQSGTLPQGLSLVSMLQQLAAAEAISVREYPFPVLLLRAETPMPNDLPDEDGAFGWTAVCSGGLEVAPVPGDHTTLLMHPNVRVVAAQLERWLDNISGFLRVTENIVNATHGTPVC